MKFIEITKDDGKKLYLSVYAIAHIEEGCLTDSDKQTLEINRVFGFKQKQKNGCAKFTKITTNLGEKYFVQESYQEIIEKGKSLSWMIKKQDY